MGNSKSNFCAIFVNRHHPFVEFLTNAFFQRFSRFIQQKNQTIKGLRDENALQQAENARLSQQLGVARWWSEAESLQRRIAEEKLAEARGLAPRAKAFGAGAALGGTLAVGLALKGNEKSPENRSEIVGAVHRMETKKKTSKGETTNDFGSVD